MWKAMTHLAVDEISGLPPDNAQEEGVDKMKIEETEALVTDEGIVPFEAI